MWDSGWTLHVENFAKIASADVRLAPFMCFVGENNTGKSYLMSLLWGILTLGMELFPRIPSEAKSYKKCENWLKDHLDQDMSFVLEDYKLYIDWFNDLLSANKKRLLRRIFNYEVEAGKIEITGYPRNRRVEFHRKDSNSLDYSVGKTRAEFIFSGDVDRHLLVHINSHICWNIVSGGMGTPFPRSAVKGRRMGEPVYLPASRTGFMLTYPQLVEKSLQASFAPEAQETRSVLTLPYVDFLQLLTQFDTKENLRDISRWSVDFIESAMMGGEISVKKETLPVIRYQPKGAKGTIPLYVASSVVSELSPLLLLFKSDIDFKGLIIEEPEAHLHPQLQQQMARLLINLVNRGLPVWITTHSDTMLEHINNMLKLKKNPSSGKLMEEFGYTEEDLLDEKDVVMYQFTQKPGGKTAIQELLNTGYGFAVSTFNDALQQLLDEVYAFQEE